MLARMPSSSDVGRLVAELVACAAPMSQAIVSLSSPSTCTAWR